MFPLLYLLLLLLIPLGCNDGSESNSSQSLNPEERDEVIKLLTAYSTANKEKYYPQIIVSGRKVLGFDERAVKALITQRAGLLMQESHYYLNIFSQEIVRPVRYWALSANDRREVDKLIADLLYANLMEKVAVHDFS